jgi:hypothetical protein
MNESFEKQKYSFHQENPRGRDLQDVLPLRKIQELQSQLNRLDKDDISQMSSAYKGGFIGG